MPLPDPDSYTSVKHWQVTLTAGAGPVNPFADNPMRNFLYLVNGGTNALAFWFDQAKNSGQGITLGPGATWSPPGNKTPINRMFCQSLLGSTLIIMEGYRRKGEG